MSQTRSTPENMQTSTPDDFLQRDQEPSHNLHEPQSMISTIDPITGNDVGDVVNKPSLVDGNPTMYFESEQTRQAYLEEQKNHTLNLPGDNEEGEAEA